MKYKVLKPVSGMISLYLSCLPAVNFSCAVYSLCSDRNSFAELEFSRQEVVAYNNWLLTPHETLTTQP